MKTLILVTIILTLLGCATSGKIAGIQLGMNKDEVISIMGSPVSVSAIEGTEYLNYKLSETDDDAFVGFSTPYYVRFINGIVDSYGRTGDFDSNKDQTIKIESESNVNLKTDGDLYTELRKLKELLDEGILTEEEYQIQKKKVLSKY